MFKNMHSSRNLYARRYRYEQKSFIEWVNEVLSNQYGVFDREYTWEQAQNFCKHYNISHLGFGNMLLEQRLNTEFIREVGIGVNNGSIDGTSLDPLIEILNRRKRLRVEYTPTYKVFDVAGKKCVNINLPEETYVCGYWIPAESQVCKFEIIQYLSADPEVEFLLCSKNYEGFGLTDPKTVYIDKTSNGKYGFFPILPRDPVHVW